jgi:hypothetical protein
MGGWGLVSFPSSGRGVETAGTASKRCEILLNNKSCLDVWDLGRNQPLLGKQSSFHFISSSALIYHRTNQSQGAKHQWALPLLCGAEATEIPQPPFSTLCAIRRNSTQNKYHIHVNRNCRRTSIAFARWQANRPLTSESMLIKSFLESSPEVKLPPSA